MERRVTKIENFLRAGNFAKASNSKERYSIQNNEKASNEESKVIPKPKYKGKTQDYWPKLVNDFKQEGKMFMYINLAGSIAREINDMTLEIDFPNVIPPFYNPSVSLYHSVVLEHQRPPAQIP